MGANSNKTTSVACVKKFCSQVEKSRLRGKSFFMKKSFDFYQLKALLEEVNVIRRMNEMKGEITALHDLLCRHKITVYFI